MEAQVIKALAPLTGRDWRISLQAIRAYSALLGKIKLSISPEQKHWWHAALTPSLSGLSTGALEKQALDFELDLDLLSSYLCINFREHADVMIQLTGQSNTSLFDEIKTILNEKGVSLSIDESILNTTKYPKYSAEDALTIINALFFVTKSFRMVSYAQRNETGPVVLWPHHFDVAFLWFSGRLVPDKDPKDAENADEQMNIGFLFGDETISEPYFYITAYPWQDAFKDTELPQGAYWNGEGFNAAILPWSALQTQKEPQQFLKEFCELLLDTGKTLMQ